MTQRAYSVFIFFIALVVLFSPFFISAQKQFTGDEGVSGIVPCGDKGEEECNACHLVDLTQGIINFTIYLAIFVATLMFVYAGILYMSALGNTEKVSKATDIFTRVLIGLIIVLIAWLVVDTIMKAFFNDQEFGPWNDVECGSGGSSNLSPGRP